MASITKDMIISDILEKDSGIAQILRNAGMNCVGCPSARGETLAEAGLVHNMDPDVLVDEINKYLQSL